jgi:SAM-dependent methyltransferase
MREETNARHYDRMRSGLQEAYRQNACTYRQHDEIEARTDHHCWVWKTLADLSSSFGRDIAVLEAGCGTGRYFHCVQNVHRLVGVDVSPEMLVAAGQPIRPELISAKNIELRCADVHHANFAPGSFDLIYSIGMFGYGCPLTAQVLDRFYDWLSDEGMLLFDVPDVTGMPRPARVRNRIKKTFYPILPGAWQQRLDEREKFLPFFSFSARALGRLMSCSDFVDAKIYSRPVSSPAWGDKRFECLAGKVELRADLVHSLDSRALRRGGKKAVRS